MRPLISSKIASRSVCQLNNPEMILSKVLLMMILKRMMMVIGLVIKDMVKRAGLCRVQCSPQHDRC